MIRKNNKWIYKIISGILFMFIYHTHVFGQNLAQATHVNYDADTTLVFNQPLDSVWNILTNADAWIHYSNGFIEEVKTRKVNNQIAYDISFKNKKHLVTEVVVSYSEYHMIQFHILSYPGMNKMTSKDFILSAKAMTNNSLYTQVRLQILIQDEIPEEPAVIDTIESLLYKMFDTLIIKQ